MKSSFFVCLTTIQQPTNAVRSLNKRLQDIEGRLVVAGDRKGPVSFDLAGCDFLSLEDQLRTGFTLAEKLPVGHYARKNIAYLQAIRSGATCIYETDDDNAPLDSWIPRSSVLSACRRPDVSVKDWVNVYRYFSSDASIWPRGFPLECIAKTSPMLVDDRTSRHAPIQQGLANGSPDVDAVWRLTQDRPFTFDAATSVWLGEGQWCPFNTQTTWWWPDVFALLYVPSFCSFRMCDIWKSFVAQRCLWAMGAGVAFHAPEVIQDRNPHDYTKDFQDEIPGYTLNARIRRILEAVALPGGGREQMAGSIRLCYEALVAESIFPAKELKLLDAWLDDLANAS